MHGVEAINAIHFYLETQRQERSQKRSQQLSEPSIYNAAVPQLSSKAKLESALWALACRTAVDHWPYRITVPLDRLRGF
ncbi:hypothetical protein J3E69DRAFT_335717 [Trichoderma sp. SZMC 28015]